ncbi:hypothetical protein RI129_004805 [Pyrocoelia pectoralis]|uniref:acid phosphatase n=1 Tax=Pyrocoelia pectoralis TaxID=417401 RepID=A0AAN7ZRG9_9COLE
MIVMKNSLSLYVTVRHGDRTPFVSETYPKHIYNNVSYGGYGPGELTDEGRRRMYQFGQQLKRMYKNSFRSNFTISNVKAVSTEYNRTKHSLQLVLNGLFDEDETYDLFSLPNELCPRYQQTYIEYQKSEEGKKLINKYSEKFSYISEHTGSEISCIEDLVPIYHSLKSDKEFGLELPTWSLSVQRYLKSAMGDLFESYVALPELNKLFGGMLLKEILNNIDAHIETPKNEKFYLYSCHDLHIAGLLGAMDIFRSHTPDYAACVVIELHKISTAYYVKGNGILASQGQKIETQLSVMDNKKLPAVTYLFDVISRLKKNFKKSLFLNGMPI